MSKFMFTSDHGDRMEAHVAKCLESYVRPTKNSFITNAAKDCEHIDACGCNSPLLHPRGTRAEYEKLVAHLRSTGDVDFIASITPIGALTPTVKPRGRGKNQRKAQPR